MARGETICKSYVYLIWSDRIIAKNWVGHYLFNTIASPAGLASR